MPKILIADDHPLFREALKAALSQPFADVDIVESDSLQSTLDRLEINPDIELVLLDLHMPGCDNFYGLIRVSQDYANTPVAVISGSDSVQVISQVMSFGAKGFIPKSTPTAQIAEAINRIRAGQSWLPEGMQQQLAEIDDTTGNIAQKVAELTPKQFQVLREVQAGKLNKQIAYDMHVTEATVKAHISAIFRKLGVSTRTQAVLMVESLHLD